MEIVVDNKIASSQVSEIEDCNHIVCFCVAIEHMQTYIWNIFISIHVAYRDSVNVGLYETTTMQTIAWGAWVFCDRSLLQSCQLEVSGRPWKNLFLRNELKKDIFGVLKSFRTERPEQRVMK